MNKKPYSYNCRGWGHFSIIAAEYGIINLGWESHVETGDLFGTTMPNKGLPLATPSNPVYWNIAQQLKEYLSGERSSFNIRIGVYISQAHKMVYRAVSSTPYGCTVTYDLLASKIGMPNASNGVRNILIKNPLPLIIPCHRVIKSLSEPGNYVLGQSFKRRLLKLESIYKTKTASDKSVICDSA